jgi:ribonuclease BN (tRNA processing enzyme)
LDVKKLNVVFITHLHSDHTLGLPDLIFSPWVLERAEPLQVYGPRGVRSMTDHLQRAWQEDVAERFQDQQPANRTGYHVNAREINEGVVYQDERVRVNAFLVNHGSWPQAFGYRFETRDRVVVISGDASPSESIVRNCAGCDLLVHEVYSHERLLQREPEWQRYHTAVHTSTLQLADIAARAQPRLLVLYHQLYWGATDQDLVNEVKRTYTGTVVSAKDLGIY